MRRLAGAAARLAAHRGWVLAAAVLAGLALAPGVARVDTDNSPQIFFVEGSPSVARYRDFRDTFGSDKVMRVVFQGPRLWTAAGLDWQRRIEERAAELPGVHAVSGLYGRHAGPASSGASGASGASGSAWPPDRPEAFRRRVEADPLDRNLGLVGRSGEVTSLLVLLEPETNQAKTRLVEALEGLVDRPPPGLETRVVGTPVLDRALDRSSREIERRYFPLLVALAVVLLALTFRRLVAVVLPLLFVAAAEVVLLGSMGYLGVRLNLVLAVLPPLVFVIALATAVHLLVRLRDLQQDRTLPEAVWEVYHDKGWAVLWTGVTTLVGFGSLATSRVAPVRTLGLWAALGIALMTLLAFTLYPALLLGAGDRGRGVRRPLEAPLQRYGRRWAEWAARRRGWVIGTAAALGLLAVAGLPRITLESNALHYLPTHHPVRADVEELESRGVGSIAVELLLHLPQRSSPPPAAAGEEGPAGTFRSLAAFGRLAGLAEELRREPLVLGAVGPGDLLRDAVRRAPGGALFGSAVRRIAFDRLLAGASEGGPLASFLSADGREARITLFTRTVGFGRLDPFLVRVKQDAARLFPGAEVETTGEYPLILESQHQLLATLAVSLSLTVLCVVVIFRFLLGSLRLTLLALLPNLWPVVGVVGVMGWLHIPLDVATVMVASVILGLAVDDTIHTLGHFKELVPEQGRLEAVAGTLERTAPAYVLTGVILAAGFGACALSDFAPTSRFGVLSALGIFLAVVGDLVLVPALLGATPRAVVARLRERA